MRKRKNTVIILALMAALALTGAAQYTSAWFNSSSTTVNRLTTDYGVDISETFILPESGVVSLSDTVTKNVSLQNNGKVDTLVRLRYTETWKRGESFLNGLLKNDEKKRTAKTYIELMMSEFTKTMNDIETRARVGSDYNTSHIPVYGSEWDGAMADSVPLQDESGVYLIGTAEELYWFSEYINLADNTVSGRLTADIKLNDNNKNNLSNLGNGQYVTDGTVTYDKWIALYEDTGANHLLIQNALEWTPIGVDADRPFLGTFYGDGHYITGMYICDTDMSNTAANFRGLFGALGEGARVENLVLIDSVVLSGTAAAYSYGETTASRQYIGVLAGYADGAAIKNCTVAEPVIYCGGRQTGEVAAISGYANDSVIDDCLVDNGWLIDYTGTPSNSALNSMNFAGVVGKADGNTAVTDTISYIALTVNSASAEHIGGVVGWAGENTLVNKCCFGGDFYGAFNGSDSIEGIGGIVGYNLGKVSNSYTHSMIEIISNSSNIIRYVGGVVGYSATSVDNCYNAGGGWIDATNEPDDIAVYLESSGLNVSYIGGVLGGGEGCIDSYNMGRFEFVLTGSAKIADFGGVVGRAMTSTAEVRNCFNGGAISVTTVRGNTAENIGGVVGYTAAAINSCYNSGNITSQSGYTGSTQETVTQRKIGGIVGLFEGDNNAVLNTAYSYCDITLTGSALGVGGIAGMFFGSDIRYCYTSGTWSLCRSNSGYLLYAGGIIGGIDDDSESSAVNVSYCHSDVAMTVAANYLYHVGGILGSVTEASYKTLGVSYSCFQGSINTTVTARDKTYGVGGIVGQMQRGSIIMCYNTGTITTKDGRTNGGTGGILGYISTTNTRNTPFSVIITSCLNIGTVSSTYGTSYADAICKYATVRDNNWTRHTVTYAQNYYLQGSGTSAPERATRVSDTAMLAVYVQNGFNVNYEIDSGNVNEGWYLLITADEPVTSWKRRWQLLIPTAEHAALMQWGDGSGTYTDIAALEDWTDGGDGWYYYNKVLHPGEATAKILDSLKLNEKIPAIYNSAKYTLTFYSESVQAEPAEAVRNLWGYEAAIDENGNVLWTFN